MYFIVFLGFFFCVRLICNCLKSFFFISTVKDAWRLIFKEMYVGELVIAFVLLSGLWKEEITIFFINFAWHSFPEYSVLFNNFLVGSWEKSRKYFKEVRKTMKTNCNKPAEIRKTSQIFL